MAGTHDTVRVSFESRVVCYIQCFRRYADGTRSNSATATGFHWSDGSTLYFITNWHNVTGRNPQSNEPNGSFTPTHLHIWFIEMQNRADETSRYTKFIGKEIALYDDSGNKRWIEHPNGRLVDIVAIKIDNYDWEDSIYTINSKPTLPDFKPMCGDDCYIVGYPDGFKGPGGMPIWKRASIATEPELNYQKSPLFLADSLTRPGMSGAPVFSRVHGIWGQEGAGISIGGKHPTILGHLHKFIGIYAGREGNESEGFQLARIWKSSVIKEIIANSSLPEHTHID